MKSLIEFIKENMEVKNIVEAEDESKSFEFSFKELPNANETIESLKTMAEDNKIEYEATEDSFTITIKKSDCANKEKLAGIQDVLQQYSDLNRADSKNASSEAYAQKTAAFERNVDEFHIKQNYINF